MLIGVLIFSLVHLCLARDVLQALESSRISRNHSIPDGRIIGGNTVQPHTIKYMVFVRTHDVNKPADKFRCGGSLISKRHVLTAAHCLEDSVVEYVLLGAHDVSKKEKEQLKVLPEKWVTHGQYDNPADANDLGIIKLAQDVTPNNYISIVTLESASDASKPFVGDSAQAYGWGLIHDTPKAVSTNLLWGVEVKVISNRECLGYSPDKTIYNGDICTSGKNTVGTCNGDSGGPLMHNGVQIGITSRGVTGPCEIGEPSVYARVGAYRRWIDQQMRSL